MGRKSRGGWEMLSGQGDLGSWSLLLKSRLSAAGNNIRTLFLSAEHSQGGHVLGFWDAKLENAAPIRACLTRNKALVENF